MKLRDLIEALKKEWKISGSRILTTEEKVAIDGLKAIAAKLANNEKKAAKSNIDIDNIDIPPTAFLKEKGIEIPSRLSRYNETIDKIVADHEATRANAIEKIAKARQAAKQHRPTLNRQLPLNRQPPQEKGNQGQTNPVQQVKSRARPTPVTTQIPTEPTEEKEDAARKFLKRKKKKIPEISSDGVGVNYGPARLPNSTRYDRLPQKINQLAECIHALQKGVETRFPLLLRKIIGEPVPHGIHLGDPIYGYDFSGHVKTADRGKPFNDARPLDEQVNHQGFDDKYYLREASEDAFERFNRACSIFNHFDELENLSEDLRKSSEAEVKSLRGKVGKFTAERARFATQSKEMYEQLFALSKTLKISETKKENPTLEDVGSLLEKVMRGQLSSINDALNEVLEIEGDGKEFDENLIRGKISRASELIRKKILREVATQVMGDDYEDGRDIEVNEIKDWSRTQERRVLTEIYRGLGNNKAPTNPSPENLIGSIHNAFRKSQQKERTEIARKIGMSGSNLDEVSREEIESYVSGLTDEIISLNQGLIRLTADDESLRTLSENLSAQSKEKLQQLNSARLKAEKDLEENIKFLRTAIPELNSLLREENQEELETDFDVKSTLSKIISKLKTQSQKDKSEGLERLEEASVRNAKISTILATIPGHNLSSSDGEDPLDQLSEKLSRYVEYIKTLERELEQERSKRDRGDGFEEGGGTNNITHHTEIHHHFYPPNSDRTPSTTIFSDGSTQTDGDTPEGELGEDFSARGIGRSPIGNSPDRDQDILDLKKELSKQGEKTRALLQKNQDLEREKIDLEKLRLQQTERLEQNRLREKAEEDKKAAAAAKKQRMEAAKTDLQKVLDAAERKRLMLSGYPGTSDITIREGIKTDEDIKLKSNNFSLVDAFRKNTGGKGGK